MKFATLVLAVFVCAAVPAFAGTVTVTGTSGCTSTQPGITATITYGPSGSPNTNDPGNNTTYTTPNFNNGTNPGCTPNWLGEAGGQSTTITFTKPVTYVGFVWGTPDAYNTFQIYDGATLLGSYTGSNVTNNYMNFFAGSGQEFTSVVFASSSCCFETTNFSYTEVSGVPEPPVSSMLWCDLLCLAFAIALRRGMSRGFFRS
jgi:hypothetical protein